MAVPRLRICRQGVLLLVLFFVMFSWGSCADGKKKTKAKTLKLKIDGKTLEIKDLSTYVEDTHRFCRENGINDPDSVESVLQGVRDALEQPTAVVKVQVNPKVASTDHEKDRTENRTKEKKRATQSMVTVIDAGVAGASVPSTHVELVRALVGSAFARPPSYAALGAEIMRLRPWVSHYLARAVGKVTLGDSQWSLLGEHSNGLHEYWKSIAPHGEGFQVATTSKKHSVLLPARKMLEGNQLRVSFHTALTSGSKAKNSDSTDVGIHIQDMGCLELRTGAITILSSARPIQITNMGQELLHHVVWQETVDQKWWTRLISPHCSDRRPTERQDCSIQDTKVLNIPAEGFAILDPSKSNSAWCSDEFVSDWKPESTVRVGLPSDIKIQ